MPDKWPVTFRGEQMPYSPRLHERSTPAKGQRLPTVWIGYDSEAATCDDGFPEVQTIQTHNGKTTRLEYVASGDAFRHFWSIIMRSVPESLIQTTKKKPVTVPVYCHNWEYDFGMVMKAASEAWRNQAKMNKFYPGFTDTVIVERAKWTLTVEQGHMTGNAPLLVVTLKRKGLHVRLRLLDTFPFFPKALATVAKDLKLTKGDRASILGIDWRTKTAHEPVTATDEKGQSITVTKAGNFEPYGRDDAVTVWGLGGRIMQLHEVEGLTSLAVSGAGYAAKVMLRNLDYPFQGSFGGKPAVQIALDAFHGGRSGHLIRGHVSGASVYDFRSSYPSIQISLPALHQDYTYVYWHRDLPVADFLEMARRYHGFARVSGIETDTKYPALLSANEQGSIRPVVGAFHNVPATAAEVYLGAVFGGLRLTEIPECVFYAPREGEENANPFRSFIQRAWDRKNSFPKGSIEYDAAKIQANSGYGKMIEHRNSNRYVQDDIQIPLYKPGVPGEEEARNFFLDYQPDYWHDAYLKWSERTDTVIGYGFLAQLLNSEPEFGYYATPQYAAWITGHAHARLVLMMRLFDAIKWDTDSATTLLSESQIAQRIASFPAAKLPVYIQALSIGDGLGELDMEGRNMAGVIWGKKRYYLEGEVKKEGGWVAGHKEGHHGMPGVDKLDLRAVLFGLPEVMNQLGEIEYLARPKPDRMRGAKTWAHVGLFQRKTYKPKFVADDKQDWQQGGAYREFAGFA